MKPRIETLSNRRAVATSGREPLFQLRRIDFGDMFALAYLVFFLLEPIARRSTRYWLECIPVLCLFLALWFSFLYSRSIQAKRWIVVAVAVLGLATMPLNASGGVCFLIYVVSLIPYSVTGLRWQLSLISADLALLYWVERWQQFPASAMFFTLFFAMVGGGANLFFAEKERNNCKLQRKQEEIEALAALAERERIARDLHDVLGHTLSVIVLKSELAGRLLDRHSTETDLATLQRARAELTDVERTARSALAEVREAIGGYRARGLAAEIDAARHTLATAGVTLTTEGELSPATLTAGEETVLSLALREAVTNIVRHAQATSCHLQMVVRHGQHRLSIEDNGQHTVAQEGNGLRGMRERVESLGGQLSLTRKDGTHLLIEIPLRTSTAI